MPKSFNPKDPRANPSQEEEVDAYQPHRNSFATLFSTPKSKTTFLDKDGHRSSILLDYNIMEKILIFILLPMILGIPNLIKKLSQG